MWNEGGEFNMVDHSFSGRKLMPLMARPMTSPNTAPPPTTLSLTHPRGNDFPSQYDYHHLGIYITFSLSLLLMCVCSVLPLLMPNFYWPQWQIKTRESSSMVQHPLW